MTYELSKPSRKNGTLDHNIGGEWHGCVHNPGIQHGNLDGLSCTHTDTFPNIRYSALGHGVEAKTVTIQSPTERDFTRNWFQGLHFKCCVRSK